MLAILASFCLSALIAPHEEKSFISWMRKSNQFYTGEEYHFRLGIFLTQSRYIREFNSVKRSFKLGLNDLSCYTPSEYRCLLGNFQSLAPSRQKIIDKITNDLPESVDWRNKGVVNEIQNQGLCGSCWAFSSVQACESAYAISHGTLFKCSEQNIIDCCHQGGCSGCSGGYNNQALDFILNTQNGFLNSESDYPYIGIDGDCKFDSTKGISQIKSIVSGIKGDEDYLKKLVSQGVCSIAIDGSWVSFQEYSGGIYDNPMCTDESGINHAVGLVGYGSENGVDYWIVRNSWGIIWGEDGYVRMSRNKENQCGISNLAFLVLA